MKKVFHLSALLAVALIAGITYAADPAPSSIPSAATVKLSQPRHDGGMPIEKTLATRRSVRAFTGQTLQEAQVSQLLWAAQGLTDAKGHRTAPSARAKYALETYLIAGSVTGLAAGIYRYDSASHSLTLLMSGDRRAEIVDKAVGQEWVKTAPAAVVLTGVADRMTFQSEKIPRFMYVEAGLAAQNFFLQAVSLGLGSTYVGGFKTDALAAALNLPKGEETIALLPVGVPQ